MREDESYVAWLERMEERRREGVHRWDYPHPCNLWETWPWWLRWPIAGLLAIYFLGGLLAPLLWR